MILKWLPVGGHFNFSAFTLELAKSIMARLMNRMMQQEISMMVSRSKERASL
jgi:hypothetical protein